MVMFSSGSSSSSSCVVCSKAKASYKCPKCRSVYCSLGCNKSHKLVCHLTIPVSTSVDDLGAEQPESQSLLSKTVTSEVEKRCEILGSNTCIMGDTRVLTNRIGIVTEDSHCSDESLEDKNINENIDANIDKNIDKNIDTVSNGISENTISNIKNDTNLDRFDPNNSSVSEVVSAVDESDISKSSRMGGVTPPTSSRRVNHDIDTNDMEILNSQSVQSLLQSEWAKKLLKSSRLRDDILSVDSAPNRQGERCAKNVLLILLGNVLLIFLGNVVMFIVNKSCVIFFDFLSIIYLILNASLNVLFLVLTCILLFLS